MTIPFSQLPHPPELPLLGSLHRRFGNRAKTSLDFFSEMARLGPVVRFNLLNQKFVLLNEPSLIQEVLVTQASAFYKGRALERAKQFLGNSLLVSEEEEHARQRKLLQPAFHRARIAGYAKAMARDAAHWTKGREAGQVLDIAWEMNRLTLSIVADTLFGSEVESEAHEISDSLTVIIENFNRMISPFYVLLKHLPTAENRRLRLAQKRVEQTIHRLIAERRLENKDRGDLLSMLLAAEDADSAQRRLSDREIRDQALTLFIAGHETTANALAWTWHLLAQHPKIYELLREEIAQVLGPDRLPEMEDVARLPYATAIVSEAMRLFPPVWIIGRRAIRDVVIGGYEIPRDVVVLSSQYLMHRDVRFWPEPLAFKPERWLVEDSARPKFAYFPFGGGARICIGESFAWMEAVLILTIVARKWRFQPVPDYSAALNPTVTLRPKDGLRMMVVNP